MSNDRGAFGDLLSRAKAIGIRRLMFGVDLHAADDDENRWWVDGGSFPAAHGRTGEEALRRLVERIEST